MTGPGTPLGAGTSAGTTFSVREFARTATGSHRAEIDLDALSPGTLDGETLRTLRFLAEIERATMSYLRRVLVTPTHKDARITAFLTTWAYEKYWIADALVQVAGEDPDAATAAEAERPLHALASRLSPIGRAIVTNLIGPDVIAAYMATASVDEAVVERAYRILAASTEVPALRALLERLVATKERHQVFLRDEARRRLAASALSRALTRRILPRVELPIGADDAARADVRDFWSLFDVGTLRELDRFAASFPGLGGSAVVTSASVRGSRAGSVTRRAGRRLGALARRFGGRA